MLTPPIALPYDWNTVIQTMASGAQNAGIERRVALNMWVQQFLVHPNFRANFFEKLKTAPVQASLPTVDQALEHEVAGAKLVTWYANEEQRAMRVFSMFSRACYSPPDTDTTIATSAYTHLARCAFAIADAIYLETIKAAQIGQSIRHYTQLIPDPAIDATMARVHFVRVNADA